MAYSIEELFSRLQDKQEADPHKYGDKLAKIGTVEVEERLISIVKGNDLENAFIAAMTLAKMENNKEGLDAILEVIHDPKNKNQNGGLVSILEDFDLSLQFVDIFRIFLFGNFKSSSLAKEYLDYKEFTINHRTLKKAEKHWNHFRQNSKPDEAFELKRVEVEHIFKEIRDLLEI